MSIHNALIPRHILDIAPICSRGEGAFDLTSVRAEPIRNVARQQDGGQGLPSRVDAGDRTIPRRDAGKKKPAPVDRLEPTEVELACFRMVEKQDYRSCADLLVALNRQAGTHIYRPAVFRACLKALQMCAEDTNVTFNNAAIQMREQNRLIGRPLPSVAVGSTLLVKGLEAECAVVLETERMNANNLYVAMTCGAISLAVCSRSPFVNA